MRPGKYFIIAGALLLLLWFYSAFWPISKAEVFNVKAYSFNQAGYAGSYRASSYQGGLTRLSITKYSYEVQGKTYVGNGFSKVERLNNGQFNKIEIHYLNFFPAISFSSRNGLLVFALVIIFIGFGLMQVRFFVKKWLREKHP